MSQVSYIRSIRHTLIFLPNFGGTVQLSVWKIWYIGSYPPHFLWTTAKCSSGFTNSPYNFLIWVTDLTFSWFSSCLPGQSSSPTLIDGTLPAPPSRPSSYTLSAFLSPKAYELRFQLKHDILNEACPAPTGLVSASLTILFLLYFSAFKHLWQSELK